MSGRFAFGGCLLVASSMVLAACGGDDAPADPAGTDDAAAATSGAGAGTGSGGGAGVGGGGGSIPEPLQRATISGDATWTVTFDADAKAAGMTDCTYTRHYEGVEDRSSPWVCAACEIVFRADVQMTAGKAECFDQFSPDPPAEKEWIGYGNGVWYRGPALTTEQGTADVSESSVTYTHTVMALDVPAGGTMSFAVAGDMTLGTAEGDPSGGFTPPDVYACGWPKANPPAYEGDYAIVAGATVPDGVFLDACSEPVRIHDFKGSYLFIEMSARDCPPCQAMAAEEEQFVADLKAQGVDVHVITLLAPSLANPLAETTKSMLDGWISKYDLTSPVLADRAWGLAMFIPIYTETVGYPSWVLADKDLVVMEHGNGFSGFDGVKATILADQ